MFGSTHLATFISYSYILHTGAAEQMVDGGRGGRRGSNVEGGVYKGLMSGGCQEKQERRRGKREQQRA